VRQLIDRTEIIERKHAYCRHADRLDPDAMVTLFADDCVARYRPVGEPIAGKQALRDFYATALSTVIASSHHVSNFEVWFPQADRAVLRCYLYSWQRFGDFPAEPDRHRWARYEDTWVRTDNVWLQASLSYLVAGEAGGGDNLRVGEYVGTEW
jgi:hypothetical protein